MVNKKKEDKSINETKVTKQKTTVKNADTTQKEVKEQNTPPAIKRQVVDIDRNALIPCKSVVYGQLTYVSPRTKIPYIWSDYGSEEMIEFGELITMRSSYPKFMTKPWILIEDEEVVAYFRLQDTYDKLLPLDDIDEFLTRPFNEIEALFVSAPMGMKQTFAGKVSEMVRENKISDLRLITLIDKTLGTGLKEFL